jgi:glycosyltransferase involved in cell wall biosynthesis
LSKPPVVILSGVRWDFLWQRHHNLATLFAPAGYPTVFVETTGLASPRLNMATLRKVASRMQRAGAEHPSGEKGLTVYSPLAAPPKGVVSRWLNRRFFVQRVVEDLEQIVGSDPVVVAYPPTRTTLDLISGLNPRLVYYDCADDYAHFPGVPRDIVATERELLRRADLVSCTSTHLLEKVRSSRPDAFLSGPAVDYERFRVLQENRPGTGVRTACLFGHVSRERTDFSALRTVAGAGFEVRIVGDLGRVDKDVLGMPGIDYKGEVPHAELPAALGGVEAFVLPYKVNGLTRGIAPAKTYECLATGKPVVAAPLPALEELAGHVYLAESPQDYVRILQDLERLETEEKVRARIELARKNSWETRFEEVEEALWRAL